MAHTADRLREALAPTRHPHPLLTASAVAQTVQAAEATRERADQLDAGAREHTEHTTLTADLEEHADLEAPVIHKLFGNRIRAAFNPLLITRAEVEQQLTAAYPGYRGPSPLTAAQRGPAWRAKYGCTPWCVMDHAGADGVPGWCSGTTAQVAAPTTPADHISGREPLPVLAARVVQCNDSPEEFGIKTRIWFEADLELYELDVPQARTTVARLKAFVPQLEAMCEQLERAAVDDRPGDPEAQARYMAALDARIKAADATEDRG
ncbi:DUF6907 domain-containing protein [Streptomyces caeni]|uniref:DUF6907 domain-containing protein n=1 Tax=Streptomyces caeni TaxID=2307231 RepID=A0ABW4ITF8_9ACTN